MNELKPEDVMRALEHVYFPNEVALIFRDDAEGEEFEVTFADIIALLREKDAEIERLTKERDDARSDCAVAEQNHYKCKKELETARSESITEFAERLKEGAYGECSANGYKHYVVSATYIDIIAKEMKGETE